MRKVKQFCSYTLPAIGISSGFVTIFWAIYPLCMQHLSNQYKWQILLLIFGLPIIFGLIAIRRKNKLKLKISEKVTTTIKYGDLFKSEGVFVVPVNEYFDMKVDDKIISSNTVHGMFVKSFFGGNEEDLRKQIVKGLSSTQPIEVNDTRAQGNKKRYDLGTVCEVHKDNRVIYLVAFTRFNNNNRAEVSNTEYQQVLCKLLDFIEQNSQGRRISLPLLGGGHSGVSLPKQKLLDFLLFSIYLSQNLTLINGIEIILHDSIKEEIDLSLTEEIFKQLGK